MPNGVCGQDQAVDLRFVGPADPNGIVEVGAFGRIAAREEVRQPADLVQCCSYDLAVGESVGRFSAQRVESPFGDLAVGDGLFEPG